MGIAGRWMLAVVMLGSLELPTCSADAAEPLVAQSRPFGQRQAFRRQQLLPSLERDSVAAPHVRVFTAVQQGVTAGSAATFSDYFASQVFLHLRGGDGSYYSATQAFYVLDAFLKSRKTTSCLFSTFGTSESNPYATGAVTFVARGLREEAQIYVALQPSGDRWVITHLSIY